MAKTPGTGFSAAWTRFRYYMRFVIVGIKWTLIEMFTRHRKLDVKKTPRRPGDIVVITGGARGIGEKVIKKLLILDMHVVMGVRNELAANNMITKLRNNKGIQTGTVDILKLDLMSLNSVREFGNKVVKKYRKIHILINNAGIMFGKYKVTQDGFESQFQVNYLSHFLLTNILLPRLKRTGTQAKPARIVNVSSVAYYGGQIDFLNLNSEQLYSEYMGYMQSKLMQVVSAKYLQARLAEENCHVQVYSCHPGIIKTDLYENVCWATVFSCCLKVMTKNTAQGSDGVVYVAISPEINNKGGSFFENCQKQKFTKEVTNLNIQQKLWDASWRLAKLDAINVEQQSSLQNVFSSNESTNINVTNQAQESAIEVEVIKETISNKSEHDTVVITTEEDDVKDENLENNVAQVHIQIPEITIEDMDN